MTDSDDDWFNQDEEAIVQSLQNHVEATRKVDNTEYIKCEISAAESYLKQLNIDSSALASADKGKGISNRFSAAELRKLMEMSPIDKFLYITTEPNRDLFVDQLSQNDTQKRVFQYTRILEAVCNLELPGFELDLLRSFAAQIVLFDHYKRTAAKLFSSKDDWDDESLQLLTSMKYLLLRAYRMGVLSSKGIEVLCLMRTLIQKSNSVKNLNLQVCVQLIEELEQISDFNGKIQSSDGTNAKNQIYPTLDELIGPLSTEEDNVKTSKYGSTEEYLKTQREMLRADFLLPLKDFVSRLRSGKSLDDLTELSIWENTSIILNPMFDEAKRHGFIFLDILGTQRTARCKEIFKLTKEERSFCNGIKNGALLCFSSSKEFEDLVLATVTFSDEESLRNGYVGIEILQQYNVGNIYGKRFIMFQSPAFFEPYNRVYNYLNNCSIENFPMQNYIIQGEIETKRPIYLGEKTSYMHNGKPFLFEEPPSTLTLNSGQRDAYSAALTNDFCLIQGPPGSGKTHLSVELVRTLVENLKEKCTPIIVVAYTNDSLDKFLLKLSVNTDSILRFGSQTRFKEVVKYNVHHHYDVSATTPRLKRLYWKVSVEYKEHFKELQMLHKEFDGTDEAYKKIVAAQSKVSDVMEKLNMMPVLTQYFAARDKMIIGMTTTYAAKINFMFRLLKSPVVIFEEAAEILESHVLACLTPHTQHVIMIGDHKQLQPYTSSYEHSRANELNISMFERLIRQNFKVHVLDTQYRMRQEIAALISPLIYEKLNNGDNIKDYPTVRNMAKSLFVVEHNQTEQTKQNDLSYMNEYEAKKLFELATHLLTKAKYTPNEIVVLTPYQAQVEQIKRQFSKDTQTVNIQIATVDSFQGLEADIVLLSLVRSNTSNLIGFIRQANRICVALSRAKIGLYIIGNMVALSRVSNMWREIVKQLRAEDCIGKEFPTLNDCLF